MPDTDTTVKNIIITGASRRLGLLLSERFIDNGWQVHALTRKASDGLYEIKHSDRGDRLTIYEIEAYNTANVTAFVTAFLANNTTLDALINNASKFTVDGDFPLQGSDFYEELMFIHMTLPALLVYGLKDNLINAKGNVISITDIYADNPNADYGLYCSTKAGLQNLTLSFAKQLAPAARANCIQPGPIQFLDEHTETQKQNVLNETLLACEGGFEPVYQTIKFILDNHYVTGDCIKVDGGRSLKRG